MSEAELLKAGISILGLFTGVFMSISIGCRLYYKNEIGTPNMVMAATGWTIFISVMWII